MIDCIFCNIANKNKEAEIIHETSDLLVFKDIRPKAPVHLLIIPKKHVVSIKDLEEEDRELAADLLFTAKEAAASQGLTGYRLCFNVGREGGQVVDHLHLHLLGGWNGGTSEIND